MKLAKSVLSSDRDNLILWDGYARLERKRGNIAAARAVYVAALQGTSEGGPRDPEDERDLWASWAEMEVEEDAAGRCLEVVLMAAGLELDRLSTPGPSANSMRD